MKFELNDYHRNITNEELIEDVKRVAYLLGKESITIDEYNRNGKFNQTTVTRRFGNWKAALEIAQLSTESHNFFISDEDYIADMQRIAFLLSKETLTISEYRDNGRYNANKLSKRFGSWDAALKAALLKPTGFNSKVSDMDLFKDIEDVWVTLGRQPKTSDIKNGISKYGMTTYIRHFGSWRKALEAFVLYINTEENVNENNSVIGKSEKTDNNSSNQILSHKTKRDINLRLRFLVLKRDNFKCCACGASPAKDPSVELHIDHIFPWSKGGETVIDNLQTLCSKCNIGKSDVL